MHLKQFVIIIFISAVLASCADTPKPVDCKQYKNGKFRFSGNFNGRKINYIIERNNKTQVEQCAELGTTSTFMVNWKDDCTYQLVFMNDNDSLSLEVQNAKRKTVVQTTILSGTENYYLFETSSSLYDKVMKDTMWLIK
jgi:hypothetical protein